MPPICSSVLILGLVLTSAVAQTTVRDYRDEGSLSTAHPTATQRPAATEQITSRGPRIGNADETSTDTGTIVAFPVTPSDTTSGDNSSTTAATAGTSSKTDSTPSPAPKTEPARTSHSTPAKDKDKDKEHGGSYGNLVLIIIIVVTLVAVLALGLTCFCSRRRSRFSVDLNSRHDDDAQIPLSSVDPDVTPVNGMQTLDKPETIAEEPEEEQKGEADKPAGEAASEPPAPSPSPASSSDKLGEGKTDEASPKEQSPEEKTDDEGVSNKTSVESLKEPAANENSNNNNIAALTAAKGMMGLIPADVFIEVPLDSPV